MKEGNIGRRAFLERSALALGASTLPLDLLAQTTVLVRPEWQTFKTTPRYDSLLTAINLMKANTNAADPNSWAYWTNVHINFCPHGTPYFLAWHRGYLYYFERRLRLVSGDNQLVLPYWDYYSYATMPAEFTNPSGDNPLYADRMNSNVQQVLSMAPFSPSLTNFQRNTSNAFEPAIEDAPHNPLHDLVGNAMATMQSPLDPIFWLHHANIDRLWVAWASAGGGRRMPAASNSYWAGAHTYATGLSLSRIATYSTRTTLGYRYANEKMPLALPVAQSGSSLVRRVQATPGNLPGFIPAVGPFRLTGPRQTGKQTFSVSGALNVGLDEISISVQLPASSEHARALSNIGAGKAATIPGRSEAYRSVLLVLDNIELSDLGKRGGYFYRIYLNIPAKGGARPTSVYVGTLGAFKIHGAMHHAGALVQLVYPIRRALVGTSPEELSTMSVSFHRVSGDNSPKGGLIGIGEVRLEVSTDDLD